MSTFVYSFPPLTPALRQIPGPSSSFPPLTPALASPSCALYIPTANPRRQPPRPPPLLHAHKARRDKQGNEEEELCCRELEERETNSNEAEARGERCAHQQPAQKGLSRRGWRMRWMAYEVRATPERRNQRMKSTNENRSRRSIRRRRAGRTARITYSAFVSRTRELSTRPPAAPLQRSA